MVRPLTADDASSVSSLIRRQPPEYARFFFAFPADDAVIARLIAASVRDCYAGLFWEGEMVGFYMLRGWDDGYDIPSFGIMVDHRFRGGTFMRISLDIAKMTARLAGARKLMAKVHPDNVDPIGARRLGLVEVGREAASGNVIYHAEL